MIGVKSNVIKRCSRWDVKVSQATKEPVTLIENGKTGLSLRMLQLQHNFWGSKQKKLALLCRCFTLLRTLVQEVWPGVYFSALKQESHVAESLRRKVKRISRGKQGALTYLNPLCEVS